MAELTGIPFCAFLSGGGPAAAGPGVLGVDAASDSTVAAGGAEAEGDGGCKAEAFGMMTALLLVTALTFETAGLVAASDSAELPPPVLLLEGAGSCLDEDASSVLLLFIEIDKLSLRRDPPLCS